MDMKKVYNKIMDLMLDCVLFNEQLSDFMRMHKSEFAGVSADKIRELWLCVRAMCNNN